MKNAEINRQLIAPCGMNCSLCLGFQRKKNTCSGCMGLDHNKPKSCRECSITNCPELAKSEVPYCYGCAKFPCRRLKQLDQRYRTKYGMSMIDNLHTIKTAGLDDFIESEKKKWACVSCGTLLCVHRNTCQVCGVNI